MRRFAQIFRSPFVADPGVPKAALRDVISGTQIMLDGNTHLGRMNRVEHASERTLPEGALGHAKTAILIEDAPGISRNHAIVQYERGKWYITDLNSANGTYVNGKRIEQGTPKKIGNGDIIKIGEKEFLFISRGRITDSIFGMEDGLTASVGIRKNNFALLVGNPGFPHLKGVEPDIKSMERLLNGRAGFNGNITTLFRESAKRKAVLDTLKMYRRLATEDSLLVFYYSGHGSRKGELCTYDWMTSGLDPKSLYDALKEIRGEKLVLLDCCHSTKFLAGVPPRTLLICGEDYEGHAFEGGVTMVVDLNGESSYHQGLLTRAFIKLIEGTRGRKINLKEEADKLKTYRGLRYRNEEVYAEGVSIVL